ncbi:DNA-directed RNA polymerases IV and V subunit 4-like [Malania oleifera]|uniref:DNA-directed RNA polymerases IV and V subunit 4-like n=1 Tax=Malania oleifera TaxID=397392 RepID=UPI0025AE7AA6|nr:DNA-directed RNA polymerases IV and V subunit 4-like [Malania oleifera]
MAEKGGKGFSLPKNGGKSALKTPLSKEASLKGKDDSSAKAKRGKKVQFCPEGSLDTKVNVPPKSGGKSDTPVAKGDLNRGGKGDKTLNGGKSSVPKEPPPLELRVEQEIPRNARCLMDCEAAYVLQGIQEQMAILSEDPTIKLPIAFDKGLLYGKTSSYYRSPQSVRRVLETLAKHGVSDGEICMIANICPETVDEVFALMPSLKDKRSKLREPLKDVLSELAMLKRPDMKPNAM